MKDIDDEGYDPFERNKVNSKLHSLETFKRVSKKIVPQNGF